MNRDDVTSCLQGGYPVVCHNEHCCDSFLRSDVNRCIMRGATLLKRNLKAIVLCIIRNEMDIILIKY